MKNLVVIGLIIVSLFGSCKYKRVAETTDATDYSRNKIESLKEDGFVRDIKEFVYSKDTVTSNLKFYGVNNSFIGESANTADVIKKLFSNDSVLAIYGLNKKVEDTFYIVTSGKGYWGNVWTFQEYINRKLTRIKIDYDKEVSQYANAIRQSEFLNQFKDVDLNQNVCFVLRSNLNQPDAIGVDGISGATVSTISALEQINAGIKVIINKNSNL